MSITGRGVGVKTTSPAYTLDVTGDINFTGNLTKGGVAFSSGTTSHWANNGSNVYVNTGSNVGIGTSSPSYNLDVNGNARVTGQAYVQGNLGVYTTNPIYNLDVNGTAGITGELYLKGGTGGAGQTHFPYTSGDNYIRGNTIMCDGGSANTVTIGSATLDANYRLRIEGKIYATDDIVGFSDKRYKSNITVISNSLKKLKQLHGYTYNLIKEESTPKKRHTGLIAQEVLRVLPEAVYEGDDGFYGLAYGNMAGLFVEAIKEVDAKYNKKIRKLSKQITSLERQVRRQKR
jgi:hypothetical protein